MPNPFMVGGETSLLGVSNCFLCAFEKCHYVLKIPEYKVSCAMDFNRKKNPKYPFPYFTVSTSAI